MEKEKIVSANDLLLSVRDDPDIDGKHFARFKEHINHAPDAVKHGRWEWYADRCEDLFLGCDDDYGWRCSKCKVPLDDEDGPEVMPTFRYCPNCGAKMDGDGNG
jgi:hypothetical protein